MAVTSGKKKARLDFSTMVADAVPGITQDAQPKVEQTPDPVPVQPVPAKEELPQAEPVREEQSKEQEAIQEPMEVSLEEEQPVIEEPKAPKTKKRTQPKKEEIDDLDLLLSAMKTERGVQKSVYLDADVYSYIQDKCKKTNAKFSSVLNILLRSAINNQNRG